MSVQRQLAAPSYLVALALMFIPPIDTVAQVLPVRAGDVRWRFGFFGLISNSLMLSLTGLLIAFLVTVVFEHRSVQRVLGIASALVMIGLLGALAAFALDTLQVAGTLNPQTRHAFRIATGTAVVKSLIGVLTLAGFAWASLKAPRGGRHGKSNPGGPSLIIAPHPSGATPKSSRAVGDERAIRETQPR
jgi:hypothetical protein